MQDGSTAAVALLKDQVLYTANVGDSEILLAHAEGGKLQPVTLTEKHLPTNPSEKQRVEALGGYVFSGRLFGRLAVSRALGDQELKQPKVEANYVSAEPYMAKRTLQAGDEFMIIACDGLWFKFSYEEGVNYVQKLRKANTPPAEICQKMVAEALERGSLDNITMILCVFRWEKK